MVHTLRLLAVSITMWALTSVGWAQPDYLRPIMRQIEQDRDAELTDALQRVHERTLAGVYSQEDLSLIVQALARRAAGSPEARPEIITLLGQIGRAESVPVVMGYARSNDEMVRLSAHQALGWIGDERALPLLRSIAADVAAKDPDSYENFMLAYAIGAIGLKKSLREGPVAEQFPLIRATLIDEQNWLIRADIARNLERWPGAEVWKTIFDSYEQWQEPEPYAGRLSTIVGLRYQYSPAGFFVELRKRSAPVRVFGLTAILDIGDPSDMTVLMEMSEADPDPRVRELAASALGRMMRR